MSETPRRGMRFEHSRQITGSPKAGTAKPVVMEITRTAGRRVWYRPVDTKGAGFVASADDFERLVNSWLT
jgi:hypothetical protein